MPTAPPYPLATTLQQSTAPVGQRIPSLPPEPSQSAALGACFVPLPPHLYCVPPAPASRAPPPPLPAAPTTYHRPNSSLGSFPASLVPSCTLLLYPKTDPLVVWADAGPHSLPACVSLLAAAPAAPAFHGVVFTMFPSNSIHRAAEHCNLCPSPVPLAMLSVRAVTLAVIGSWGKGCVQWHALAWAHRHGQASQSNNIGQVCLCRQS